MARYKDTAVNRASKTVKRSRDKALDRVIVLERNINIFIAAVEEVTFNVAEADAAGWMENWQANLLSGNLTS